MAKVNVNQYDPVANNNSDIDGINIAEGCPAANINNGLRELMAHIADLVGGTVTASNLLATVLKGGNIQISANAIVSTDANGNITITPNGSGNIVLQADSLIAGEAGGNADILNADDTQEMHLSGGTTTALGANLRLFGSTHATKPSDMQFRRETTPMAEFDGDTGDFTLYEDDGTTVSVFYDASAGSFDVDLLSIGGTPVANNAFPSSPVFVPDSGAFSSPVYDVQVARYVDLGPLSYFELRMRTDTIAKGTATGNLSIDNIPTQASGTSKPVLVGFHGTFTNPPGFALISANSVLLYDTNSNRMTVDDLDFTGSGKNELFLSALYLNL